MPAQRNFEVALKDYVDRLFSLEQSERDKDYQSLSKQINQIADGVDITLNVSGEGSGLEFDYDSNSLAHSNKLSSEMEELGTVGVGSTIAIPTIKWDKNGHITGAYNNPTDTKVTQNSMNVVLSGAVYQAILEEKTRAIAAEQLAQQTALAAGTEFSFTEVIPISAWTDKATKIYNAKITGLETELIRTDYADYEAYTAGVNAVESGAGYLSFTCESVPTKPLTVRILVSSTVIA